MFDPAVWGTVGQWASAIGTTLAFTATFYVIRRDAKVRRYAQARKVAFYVSTLDRAPEDIEGKRTRWFDPTLKNLSDEPIYDVGFFMRERRGRLDIIGSREVLMPGETASCRGSNPFPQRHVDVKFRDNSGKWWDRTLDGRLHEKNRLRHWLEVNFYWGFVQGPGKWQRFKNGVRNVRTRRRLR